MASAELIWNQFSSDLYAFINARVACPEDSADLLQEAFLKLMKKPPADQANPRGWLFVVVRNLINDYYRSRPWPAELSEDQIADQPRFEVTDSEAVVSSWLKPMLMQLPEKYAKAVWMADFQGAGMNEVARELGLSVSGAKSRVQRGRKLLTHELTDCCTFQFDRQGRVDGWKRNNHCGC